MIYEKQLKKIINNTTDIGDKAYSSFKKKPTFKKGWLSIYAYKCALKAHIQLVNDTQN